MTNITIIFHSRSGNIYQLVEKAAQTARAAGAEVRVRKVAELPDPMILDKQAYQDLATATAEIPEAGLDDLVWADAIMIGTPVHYGLPAPQILNFFDHTGPVAIPGKLMNKAVSAFASGSMPHAGQQATILALHNAFCHWGSVIVSNGSAAAVLHQPGNGAPYGTGTISRHEANSVTDDNLGAIEYQTLRTLQVAGALKRGLEPEPGITLVSEERLRKFGLDI
ncbi:MULTISPECIES: flavodoxin family protein [Embleya]|uniref:TrpR-binding protein WrbA n=1 Tax=Embleya hyalina TaxID=516124 RepID=A0A401YSR6_9ACTN|nr:NAD(P)H-dependent oxidoreductase [Embleya hyalina]QNN26203.1 FMN reductase [Embleya hyalina]GCD97612.1 TrpR-binding protein WrbA [Embleya hyalina]